MSNQSFRFIHASDLHIELSVQGLGDCPEHLQERFFDAPREAAERIFQTALDEKVDFLLLSGDVISLQTTGPWGVRFLLDWFLKLQKENIPVYWIGGTIDGPDRLPAAIELPSNVHLFSQEKVEELYFQQNGVPVVRILGISHDSKRPQPMIRSGEFFDEDDDLFTVALLYGNIQADALKDNRIDYWALGGKHQREFVSRNPFYAHYPGVSLARSPEENDDCGATRVEVNEFGRLKLERIKTSPIRWETEVLHIDPEMTEEQILREMRGRIRLLREKQEQEQQKDVVLMLSWKVDVDGEYLDQLRNGNLGKTLLRELRADFSKEAPIVYVTDISPILPDHLNNEFYDQQTILGDYLRMIHFFQENPGEKLGLEPMMSSELIDYWEAQNLMEQSEQERKNSDALPNDSLFGNNRTGKTRTDESRSDNNRQTGSLSSSGTTDSFAGNSESSILSAGDSKEKIVFRPEVIQLAEVLQIESGRKTDQQNAAESDRENSVRNSRSKENNFDARMRENRRREFEKILVERRERAFREAVQLGLELLQGEEGIRGKAASKRAVRSPVDRLNLELLDFNRQDRNVSLTDRRSDSRLNADRFGEDKENHS